MPEKTKFRKTVEILSVVGMEFIAIGKIMFHTPTKIWNIPHLHFLARQLVPLQGLNCG